MFPRWLAWLFIGVIAYLIYVATQNPSHPSPDATVALPPVTEQTYPALAKAVDVEGWKRALNPDYAAKYHCVAPVSDNELSLRIIDEEMGKGDKAHCADTMTVHLVVWDSVGKKSYDGQLQLQLGLGAVAEGIDIGLIGMRVGGKRTVVIPASLMKRTKSAEKLPPALLRALPAGKVAIITAIRVE